MQIDTSLIATLREMHRKREDYHREEKSLTLRIHAICRRLVTPPNLMRKLAKKELDQAAGLYAELKALWEDKLPLKRGRGPSALALIAEPHVDGLFAARDLICISRQKYEKEVIELAKKLPVWEAWAVNVRGIGPLILGQIIGEAGDLGLYPSPGRLWKRLGVGIVDGQIQRKVKDRELAIRMGYKAERRSIIWNLGECIVKAGGEYAELYRARKAYEVEKAEAAGKQVIEAAKLAKIAEGKRDGYESKGHIDRMAKRWMTKQLLRDLWCVWNPDLVDDAKPRRAAALSCFETHTEDRHRSTRHISSARRKRSG